MSSLIKTTSLTAITDGPPSLDVFAFSPVSGVLFTEYGMEVSAGYDLPYADWRAAGQSLSGLQRRSYMIFMWGWGDWLRYGEHRYGEMYSQAMNDTGLQERTLINYKYVASHTPRYLRGIKGLTQRHYLAVAKIRDPHRKLQLLVDAAVEGWTATGELPRQANKQEGAEDYVQDSMLGGDKKDPPPATLEDEIDQLNQEKYFLERSATELATHTAWLEDTIRQALEELVTVMGHVGVVGNLEELVQAVIITLQAVPRKDLFEAIVGAIETYRTGDYSNHAEFMTKIISLMEVK